MGQSTLLSQDIHTGMTGFNCSEWNDDYDKAVRYSIANVSDGSILQQNVEVINCTDVGDENRRRLLSQRTASRAAELALQRRLSFLSSVDLKVHIILVLEESGIENITMDNAFSVLSTMLQDSVSTGSLQSSLNHELVRELGDAAPTVSVQTVTAAPEDGEVAVTRSREPTSVPSAEPEELTFMEENQWYLASGGVVIFVLLLTLGYIYGPRPKPGVKPSRVYVTEDDVSMENNFPVVSNHASTMMQKPSPDEPGSFSAATTKRLLELRNNIGSSSDPVIPYDQQFSAERARSREGGRLAGNSAGATPGLDEVTPVDVLSPQLSGTGVTSGPSLGRRSLLVSQESEMMINLEGGTPDGTPIASKSDANFSNLRDMMRSQEEAGK